MADVTSKHGRINIVSDALIFTRNGKHWFGGGGKGHLNGWATNPRRSGISHYHQGPAILCLAVTYDGLWAAAGGPDGVLLSARNIFGEQRMFHWASPAAAPVSAVALAGSGTRLWVGCGGIWQADNRPEPGKDHALRLFDGAAWKEVALAGHVGCIWGMSAVPDASRVVTASEDHTLRVWDLKRLKNPRVLTGHEGPVYAVAISTDGKLVASGGADRTVRIWSADSGAELHRFIGHSGVIRAIAIAPDGHYVFSGGNDWVVRAWDLKSISARSAPQDEGASPGQRKPVPGDDAVARSAGQVREIFGDEIKQAKKSADKVALAERLLAQSASAQDDVEQYALLVEARRLAIAAGAPALAVRVIEQTQTRFELDGAQEAANCLEQLLHDKEKLSATARKELAETADSLTEESLRRNDFSHAQRLLALAVQAVRKANDPPLARQFAQRLASVEEQEKAFATYSKASGKLTAGGGNDAEAHLEVGKYLCFVKQDWNQGLPHLAAGSDAALQAAAALELKPPASADEQVKLGDLWWSLFEGAKGNDRAAYAERSEKWYQSALPAVQGLNRTRLAKRIEELTASRGKAGGELAGAGRAPISNDTSLAANLKTAVGANHLVRTEVQGKAIGVPFYEVAPAGWLLAGLNVTFKNKPMQQPNGQMSKPSVIASVQPVYWNGKGTTNGEIYGKPGGASVSLMAKKGFAVHNFVASFDPTTLLGVALHFAKIGPAGLESSDAYASEFIGGDGQGQAGSFPRETKPPIVGICGTVSASGVSGLGLVYVDDE